MTLPMEPRASLRNPLIERHFSLSSTSTSEQSLLHYSRPDSLALAEADRPHSFHDVGSLQSYEMSLMDVIAHDRYNDAHSVRSDEPIAPPRPALVRSATLPSFHQLSATPRTLARNLPSYDIAISHPPPYERPETAEEYLHSVNVAEAHHESLRSNLRPRHRASIPVPPLSRWKYMQYMTTGAGIGSATSLGVVFYVLNVANRMNQARSALAIEGLLSGMVGGLLGAGAGHIGYHLLYKPRPTTQLIGTRSQAANLV